MTPFITDHDLADTFQILIEQLSIQHPRFVSQLQRGISFSEISTRLSGFPYQLPNEIIALYGLHNGIRAESPDILEVALFNSWVFLSLEAAFDTYRFKMDLNNGSDEEELSPLWDPRWWPLFKADGDYLVVQCEAIAKPNSPMYVFHSHADFLFAYDSVKSLLETVTAAYSANLYCVESPTRVTADCRRIAPLYLQYNPKRTSWWLDTVPAHTVEELVETLSLADGTGDGEAIARKAATALRELLDLQTVTPLIQTLQSSQSGTRLHGASLLGDLGAREAVEPLIELLRDSSFNVRGVAAAALGKIGDRRAVAPLISALGDASYNVRNNCAYALGQLGDSQAGPALVAMMKGDDFPTSVEWALGELRVYEAVPALILALRSSDTARRSVAATALGKLRDPRSLEPLLGALSDSSSQVRREATRALGNLGDLRARSALEGLQDDSNSVVRRLALEALTRLQKNSCGS